MRSVMLADERGEGHVQKSMSLNCTVCVARLVTESQDQEPQHHLCHKKNVSEDK